MSIVAPWLTNHWAVSTFSTVWSGVSPSSSVMLTFPPGVRFGCCQRSRRGKVSGREVRVTLGHQVLENLDVAIGGGSMPGSVIMSSKRIKDAKSAGDRSHIGVYVYGSGVFGDKARPKVRATHTRKPRKSRDLAVRSVPSKKSNVRLIAQLEKKTTTRPTLTRSRSPSPAATQMFFCWWTILDGGRGR